MSKRDTVSAKISSEMRNEIKELGINVSDTIRNALREEIQKKKAAKIEAQLEDMSDTLNNISTENVVKMIREDRDRR